MTDLERFCFVLETSYFSNLCHDLGDGCESLPENLQSNFQRGWKFTCKLSMPPESSQKKLSTHPWKGSLKVAVKLSIMYFRHLYKKKKHCKFGQKLSIMGWKFQCKLSRGIESLVVKFQPNLESLIANFQSNFQPPWKFDCKLSGKLSSLLGNPMQNTLGSAFFQQHMATRKVLLQHVLHK